MVSLCLMLDASNIWFYTYSHIDILTAWFTRLRDTLEFGFTAKATNYKIDYIFNVYDNRKCIRTFVC